VGPIRSINTSKAYWELKAEQVMDRVFQPASAQQAELNDAIEVDVRETTSTEANRTPQPCACSPGSGSWPA